jgi:hypothetical protein
MEDLILHPLRVPGRESNRGLTLRQDFENRCFIIFCHFWIPTRTHRIAYPCSTTASAGTTLTRSTALTCIASYIPDNLNNHTVPRERGKIGVISGCPKIVCVVQAANTGIMAGIPSVVLSEGNAASTRAFHLHQQRRSVREFAILRYLTRWPK